MNTYSCQFTPRFSQKKRPYSGFADFLRNIFQEKRLTVILAVSKSELINSGRYYTFLEGVRIPTSWEIKLMEKTFGFDTPWELLRRKQ